MNAKYEEMLTKEETLGLTSALGDPTRYGIYEAIVDAAGEPVTVAEIAEKFSLHPNVARMHLQKLADVGLLETDTRKLQGGGRPARTYRLSERVANLQFPPRDYALLASLTLEVVRNLASFEPEVLERVGRDMGRTQGRQALRAQDLDPEESDLETLLDALHTTCESLGLFPRINRVNAQKFSFEMRNCVFRELSAEYPELVCGLHIALLHGILDEYFVGHSVEIESDSGRADGDGTCILRATIS